MWLASGSFPRYIFHPGPRENDSLCSPCEERERFLRPHQDVSSSVPRELEAMLVRSFIYAEKEERSARRPGRQPRGGEGETGRAGPASLAQPKPGLELKRQRADPLCDQGEPRGHEQRSLAACGWAQQRPGGVGRGGRRPLPMDPAVGRPGKEPSDMKAAERARGTPHRSHKALPCGLAKHEALTGLHPGGLVALSS